MEDYVTFEQAQRLKDLGFDWEVGQYYNPDKTLWLPEENGGFDFNYFDDGLYSAPTLYQAKKWLIDKYSLVVSSLPSIPDPNDDVLRWRYYVDKYNPYIIQEGSIKVYDYFEEALSSGIDRALQILKEKK